MKGNNTLIEKKSLFFGLMALLFINISDVQAQDSADSAEADDAGSVEGEDNISDVQAQDSTDSAEADDFADFEGTDDFGSFEGTDDFGSFEGGDDLLVSEDEVSSGFIFIWLCFTIWIYGGNKYSRD